jgi:hypothetical protein|tara:strand:+ start:1100 stop:1354 length:255 start_codon:yes stop_codon:yes gene_type:complete
MIDKNQIIFSRLKAIDLMVANYITDDIAVSKVNEIYDRHKLVMKQVSFWEKQNNQDRIVYDLSEFGDWLFDFLGLEDEDLNKEI